MNVGAESDGLLHAGAPNLLGGWVKGTLNPEPGSVFEGCGLQGNQGNLSRVTVLGLESLIISMVAHPSVCEFHGLSNPFQDDQSPTE